MSDFLNNLIGRSYGLKPVAQPRLASRFEPAPGNPLPFQDQESALESEEFLTVEHEREPRTGLAASATRERDGAPPIKKSQGEEETPRNRARRERVARANPVADEGQQPPVEISFEMEEFSQASDAARVSALLQTSSLQSEDERLAEENPSGSSLENKAAEHAAAILEREVERESFAPPEQYGINAQAERNFEGASFLDDERPASNSSSRGQQGRELARRAVAPARVSAQSNASESLEQASAVSLESHSRDEAAESLQPTIRVTIGRIDVRAVMPDAKQAQRGSAPARKAHGPLSLEEYLKQRNGGER